MSDVGEENVSVSIHEPASVHLLPLKCVLFPCQYTCTIKGGKRQANRGEKKSGDCEACKLLQTFIFPFIPGLSKKVPDFWTKFRLFPGLEDIFKISQLSQGFNALIYNGRDLYFCLVAVVFSFWSARRMVTVGSRLFKLSGLEWAMWREQNVSVS